MIVLVRHAEAQGGQGRFIGRTDLPLSPAGLAQAQELALALARAGLRAVAASPLARACDTARPLAEALGLPLPTLDGLAEIDLGAWEGRSREAVCAADPAAYAARGRDFAQFRSPGGESFAQVQARALAALDALARGPQPVVAVTHAGVIRAVLCHVLGMPLGNLFRLDPTHARCTLLTPGPQGLVLRGFNLPAQQLPLHLRTAYRAVAPRA